MDDTKFSIHHKTYIQFPYGTKDVRCIISSTRLKPLEMAIINTKNNLNKAFYVSTQSLQQKKTQDFLHNKNSNFPAWSFKDGNSCWQTTSCVRLAHFLFDDILTPSWKWEKKVQSEVNIVENGLVRVQIFFFDLYCRMSFIFVLHFRLKSILIGHVIYLLMDLST